MQIQCIILMAVQQMYLLVKVRLHLGQRLMYYSDGRPTDVVASKGPITSGGKTVNSLGDWFC